LDFSQTARKMAKLQGAGFKPSRGRLSSSNVGCGQKLRWLSLFGFLLEGVCQLDKGRFAPGAAEERETDRKTKNESHRDCHNRITGHGRRCRTSAATAARTAYGIEQSRNSAGGRDDGIETLRLYDPVDAFVTR